MRLVSDDSLAVVAIYQEAEGEPFTGKVAVAEVIRNRAKKSGGTIASVVLKKLQFSGMNAGAANRIRSFEIDTENHIVQDCLRAWSEAKAGSDYTLGATHYFNPSLCNPDWAKKMVKTATIANHDFYKEGK